MHSYSTAVPLVRALSRFPLGTYATFPAETLRTGKNIIIKGANDFYKGIKTGNIELAKIGARRLSGAVLAGAGLEYLFDNSDKDDL